MQRNLPRHRALVAATVCALAGAHSAHAAEGPGLRDDPARRIFPTWPEHNRNAALGGSTLVVSNCNDAGAGSLRSAVASAVDGDRVDLTALICGVITLSTGAIPVAVDNLSLAGPGRDALAIDAGGTDRAFLHYGGGTFALTGLSITNGANVTTGFNIAGGGCIAAAGYLVLIDSAVRDCFASGEGAYGGGIYAYSLTMRNSILAGNTALGANELANTAGWGGGAFVYQLELENSTISGNLASNDPDDGHTSTDLGGAAVVIRGASVAGSTIDGNTSYGRGGGLASLASVDIVNSTIAGNTAQNGNGGGLFLRFPSTMTLSNSTVSDNAAPAGGGIAVYAPDVAIISSIVAGNAGGDLYNDDPMTVTGSHNLIATTAAGITLPADTLTGAPTLASLADNGGPTRTMLPLSASPAVDAGSNPSAFAFDQRGSGFPRTVGAAPDIGAVETVPQGTAPPAIAVPTASGWLLAALAALLGMLGVFAQWRRGAARGH